MAEAFQLSGASPVFYCKNITLLLTTIMKIALVTYDRFFYFLWISNNS